MQFARDKNYGYNVVCSLELFISWLAELHAYTKYERSAMKQRKSYSNQYGPMKVCISIKLYLYHIHQPTNELFLSFCNPQSWEIQQFTCWSEKFFK